MTQWVRGNHQEDPSGHCVGLSRAPVSAASVWSCAVSPQAEPASPGCQHYAIQFSHHVRQSVQLTNSDVTCDEPLHVRTIILKAVFTFSEQTPAWSARSTAWSVPASAALQLATGIVSLSQSSPGLSASPPPGTQWRPPSPPSLHQVTVNLIHHLIRAQLTWFPSHSICTALRLDQRLFQGGFQQMFW